MATDIEGWGAPERMGLRREVGNCVVLARGGIAATLAGTIGWGLGALGDWPGLGFLHPLASPEARWTALFCAGSGAVALVLSRASFRERR